MINHLHYKRLFSLIAPSIFVCSLFAILFFAIYLTGCKSIVDEPFKVADCPKIISHSPLSAATNVDKGSPILVKFNKPMMASTINSETFQLFLGTTPIAGIITFKDSTASFVPTQALQPDKDFTAKINHGVQDLAKNYMIGSYSWTFKTAPAPVENPHIMATDPAKYAVNVPLDKMIVVAFSEMMDSTSISTSTFGLRSGINVIEGVVGSNGIYATFTPSFKLVPGVTYEATISSGVKSKAGKHLQTTYGWTFTTVAPVGGTLSPTKKVNQTGLNGATLPVKSNVTTDNSTFTVSQ